MEWLIATVIAGLAATGFYMLMRRSVVKLLFGIALLSQAANLLVFTAGGLSGGGVPIVPEGASRPTEPVSDPVPQALVLTAIVIGFGVLSFSVALVHRAHDSFETDDVERIGRES